MFIKKLLYPIVIFLLLVSSTSNAYAQVADTLFIETFDTIPSLWKMSSSYTPSNQTNKWYRDTVVTRDSSRGAATDTISATGPTWTAQTNLTSPQIYIGAPYTSIGFSFDQICYIGIDNDATVQYSFDNGVTWTRFPPSAYTGGSVYDWGQGDFKFSKASNLFNWKSNDTSYVWPSNTTAWVREDFDLTDVIISSGTQSDSARVRFSLINDPSAPRGREGTHRWIVDNFIVLGQRTIGLDDSQKQPESTFKLYPNPASNQFFIESSEALNLEINIKDIDGKLLVNKQILGNKKSKVNTSDLTSGIYIVELRSTQGLKAFKLVKY